MIAWKTSRAGTLKKSRVTVPLHVVGDDHVDPVLLSEEPQRGLDVGIAQIEGAHGRRQLRDASVARLLSGRDTQASEQQER